MKVYLLRIEMLLELQCSIHILLLQHIELFPKGKQRGWSHYECDKCDEMLELEIS